MFDPDAVRRDMAQTLAQPADAPARALPRARVIAAGQSAPPPAMPEGRRRTRRGVALVALLVVAVLVLPLIVVAASYLRRSAFVPVVTRPVVATATPAPAVANPRAPASAYMVASAEPVAADAATPHRRKRWGRRWPRYRTSAAARAALARDVDEDAVRTRRLNEAAMAQARPTLGYAPPEGDQTTPR